jgi:hypothetical protein
MTNKIKIIAALIPFTFNVCIAQIEADSIEIGYVNSSLPMVKDSNVTTQNTKNSLNLNRLKEVNIDSVLSNTVSEKLYFHNGKFNSFLIKKEKFMENRRNIYSSLWTFASLNYLYADLVGLMDANVLAQYQSGVVGGIKITPNFLTAAAGFMQIPLANVFLPQVIKNEKTLRWVQIASGTVMTMVQAGTLFADTPTKYYSLFSAFEIGATAFITINAIKWKPKK